MESMVIETTSSIPTAPAADDPQLTKFSGDASPPPQPSSVPATTTACFDCNICLDFAAEPVVTLCGHLYCWPCLYRWLQRDACPGGDSPASSPPQCPVCKTAVSQATLVPIYGRGGVKPSADVPRRPAVQHHRKQGTPTSSVQQQHHHRRHRHQHQHDRRSAEEDYVNAVISPSPAINPMLRGTAFAVLPWVSSDLYCARSPYYLIGAGESAAAQRQELQSRRSLHRISVFLLCGVILCLFCF